MKKNRAKIILSRIHEEPVTYMGNGEFATSTTPKLYPLSFTIEGLAEYAKKYENINLDIRDYYDTVVEIDEIQSNDMGK